MKYEPYPYQRKAIDFIKDHPSAALLLDMGLGKTCITLTAFMELREQGLASKLLVVAPKRVAEITWPAEIETWDHLKDLKVSIIKGDAKKRTAACKAEADIYVVGRDTVAWMAEQKLCPPCDMLAVDEMQSFKNATSSRTKAMIKLRPNFRRCVGLSGTPAPNGWLDLWAQYRIIDQGEALGTSYWSFRSSHFDPGKTIMRMGRECVLNYKPKLGHELMFEDRIAPITLSMKAIDNLALPPIRFTRLYCEMDERERNEYESFANAMEGYVGGEYLKVPTDEALVSKLVQLASGTAYDENGKSVPIHPHKLEALMELIEEADGEPLLVAYWFKCDFNRIVECLEKNGIRYADISSNEAVDDWNAKRLQVGLINPAKAGHGLNLQKGGSTLVWYTMPWNYELYAQTNARLYRNGQKFKVTVIHIMTHRTIDDAVYAVLRKKNEIQNKLFADMKDKAGTVSVTDNQGNVEQRKLFEENSRHQLEAVQNERRYLYIPKSEGKIALPPVHVWLSVGKPSADNAQDIPEGGT